MTHEVKRLTIQVSWSEIRGNKITEHRESRPGITRSLAKFIFLPEMETIDGRRVTHQRIRILGSWDEVGVRHVSAEELTEHLVTMGFAVTEIFHADEHMVEIIPQ